MGCCGSARKSTPEAPEARKKKTEVFESKVPEETTDIFTCKSKQDGDAFIQTFFRNKIPLTWREFIALCKAKSLSFVVIIQEAILRPNFKTIYFNCPPLTKDDLDNVLEFAILNAPPLVDVSADVEKFADKFKGKSMVTSFNNYGGDALLVCPVPIEGQDVDIYSSLAPFIRCARIEQQTAFWARVAKDLETLIPERTVWMNTAGTQITFLHLRLDSRAKYYQYTKFTNKNYYSEKVDNAI